LLLKTSGFVSAVAKLLREKSTDGQLSSHEVTVHTDEMQINSI